MFVTGAIAILMCTCFEYLMLNLLAPDLVDIKREIDQLALEQTRELLPEKYDSVLEAQEETMENGYNGIGFYFQQFLVRLVAPVAFVASLISLFIMKKAPPGSESKEEETKRYVINK